MDRNFVRNLTPPLSEVLPHGAIAEIAEECQVTPLSVRQILRGEWDNPLIISVAIKRVLTEKQKLETFLLQIPKKDLKPLQA